MSKVLHVMEFWLFLLIFLDFCVPSQGEALKNWQNKKIA